ncbi:MAG: recombination regulator RecX [Clostridia bacterium]|nr:recombination regulator RecX [Clostridia bacterium]
MIITDKKREKGHLYRLSFDTADDCLLDLTVCDGAFLKKGSEITPERLSELAEISDYERAKSRALWYLDRGAHTEKGLYEKLIKAKFKKTSSAKVISRLKELGLLDDNRYAEIYAERLFESNISKRQIYYKLTEKGISRDLAKQTVEGLPENEEAQIKNLIEKKYKNKIGDKENIKKVYAALVRKGFSFGGVKNVLKEYEEELNYYCED